MGWASSSGAAQNAARKYRLSRDGAYQVGALTEWLSGKP